MTTTPSTPRVPAAGAPSWLGAQRVIEAAWRTGPAQHLASQAAAALDAAGMLQSPETAAADAARHHREGVAMVVAALRERAREVHTPADLLALLDDVSTAPVTVYRAECDTIPLDTYQSREAAREHCRTEMERAEPDRAGLHWVPVDEGEPDGMEVLAYVDTDGEGVFTDFIVTPITIEAAYSPEVAE